ncbi:MAG: hypothetical protein HYW24_00280 [Candidatus Aenigmarchaeota archaeon]|nr:hypothetical protein [Candidatus Aenigmarchaeota archaeon]
MGHFRIYEGAELTIRQCQSVLDQPRYEHKGKISPYDVLATFREHALDAPRYFIFEDNSLIAQIEAQKFDGNIMTFQDFWANNLSANLRFYRLTSQSGQPRTPGYELCLRTLYWGLNNGYEEAFQSMFMSKVSEKTWKKAIDSGILIPTEDGVIRCRINSKLPDLLDLESIQNQTKAPNSLK